MAKDKNTLDNGKEDMIRDTGSNKSADIDKPVVTDTAAVINNELNLNGNTDIHAVMEARQESTTNESTGETIDNIEKIETIESTENINNYTEQPTDVAAKVNIEPGKEAIADADVNSPEALADNKDQDSDPADAKKKSNAQLYRYIRGVCIVGFIIFSGLFINEVVIQPIRIHNSVKYTRDLYNRSAETPSTAAPTLAPTLPAAEATQDTAPAPQATPTPDPNRDDKGRLLQFKDLLAVNEDVKGWITIKNTDTNIDYVVTQPGRDDPDYYLDKDINGEYSKAGTLYLDPLSSIEKHTQSLVIHGHNMVSTTEKMFHEILQYKKLDFYREHPIINFDTIYDTGEWKVFAVFFTPGDIDNQDFFEYRKATFPNASGFLNFVYQIRIRSVLNVDSVDIREDDRLLILSTCSHYELGNYRTVVVARKVREGESSATDTDSTARNENVLHTKDYYRHNGGEAPVLPATFEEALEKGLINWYSSEEEIIE